MVGEANFVTNKLSEQIADNNFNIYDGKKVVETSILPIQLRKLSIAKSFSFANEGSSLITHKDKLFVADRLGNIFLFAENKFK